MYIFLISFEKKKNNVEPFQWRGPLLKAPCDTQKECRLPCSTVVGSFLGQIYGLWEQPRSIISWSQVCAGGPQFEGGPPAIFGFWGKRIDGDASSIFENWCMGKNEQVL